MIIHKLIAEDITNVGGQMGKTDTYVLFTKSFSESGSAKKYAEADYRKREKDKDAKIPWEKDGTGYTSGDLRYIMYTIEKEKVL